MLNAMLLNEHQQRFASPIRNITIYQSDEMSSLEAAAFAVNSVGCNGTDVVDLTK